VAAIAFAVYLVLATVGRDRLPLIQLRMFAFRAATGPVVVPLTLADGEVAAIEDYVDFAHLPPESVDVEHRGYECSVEHRFHEARAHLAAHQGGGGPVRIEVGVVILSLGPDGSVQRRRRIDAEGRARRR
jgi:hypothetical protein